MERSTLPTMNAAQEHAIEMLAGSQRVLLCGHARPDGDCLGAQAALMGVLQTLGKEVWILNPDQPEPQFDCLSEGRRFGTFSGGDLPVHDVAVLLDFSELGRCGDLGEALARARSKKIVVDHHIHVGDAWWDAAFVDVTASATGLLVHRIARALSVPLDPVGALGVFTSIASDTGWFKYSNTDAETLRVAAELVEGGVVPSELHRTLFQRRSKDHPRTVGRALERLEYHAEGRLAVLGVPQGTDSPHLVSDDVLDLVRSVQAVEVVLFLREGGDGTCSLSARSKTDYDVQRLARRFGGGGHAKASGATVQGRLDEVRSRLIVAAVEGFEEQI